MNRSKVVSDQLFVQRLNKYVLTEEIGRGGHGSIYRAYHEDRPDETVAVKVINDTGSLDVLLVEPELLSRLQHPNIVALRDYFLHAGKLVLVMEYVDGPDLGTYLDQNGPLTPVEIKDFLMQTASALAHAHANNIIHRDIKPSNILVTGDDQNRRYVLVDFGISRVAKGIQLFKQMAGTYYYMAPEQLRGRPCAQSDLWALGVIAYVLLTGQAPFEADTKEDLSKRILYSIPPVPSVVIDEADPDLERIIYQLLEKQLIDRTASAEELLEKLEDWPMPSTPRSALLSINSQKGRSSVPTWEVRNIKARRKSWVFFWMFLFLAIIPDNIIGASLQLAGVILFFHGQKPPQSRTRTFLGLGIVITGAIIRRMTMTDNYTIPICGGILLSYVAGLIAMNFYVQARNLERDAFMLKAFRTASTNSHALLNLLRDFVDVHIGNLNAHQKYAETLLLFGKVKEAVIEARRILEIDVYNLGATLLLAQGYFDLGLYRECEQVCDGYLAISGYSFEFSELKEQCQKAQAVSKLSAYDDIMGHYFELSSIQKRRLTGIVKPYLHNTALVVTGEVPKYIIPIIDIWWHKILYVRTTRTIPYSVIQEYTRRSSRSHLIIYRLPDGSPQFFHAQVRRAKEKEYSSFGTKLEEYIAAAKVYTAK